MIVKRRNYMGNLHVDGATILKYTLIKVYSSGIRMQSNDRL
jgi:hypothetical protein